MSQKLPSGDELPMIGLGTWDLNGETVKNSVTKAIENGYTHIDTAEGYNNEKAIGEVLSEYERNDFFITSKVLPKNLNYGTLIESCKDTLDRLGTNYLDLYLIHWPNPAISLRETLSAMATLKNRGLIKNVGVSNFSAYQLSCAHHISDVSIAINQIEFHPWFQRPDLCDYCRETDTVIEAAAPLARMNFVEDEEIQKLSSKYDKSPAQIILKWITEQDVVALPKSTSPKHISDNIKIEWTIESKDLEKLSNKDCNQPVFDTPTRYWSGNMYGIPE